jgi:hypothetical protein
MLHLPCETLFKIKIKYTYLVKRKGFGIAGSSRQHLSVYISISIIVTCDNVFVMGAASIETPNSTWRRLAASCSPGA